jgi:menaquinol-cytochrome c reductase iron-sulfur subunit
MPTVPPEPNSFPAAPTSRRSYIGWMVGLCTAGVSAVLGIPLVRFLIYPLTAKTSETKWSDVGPVADFGSSAAPVQRLVSVEQLDGWRKTVSEKVVYVTKDTAGQVRVLSAVCPHLGCSVQWVGAKKQFGCPCHGASFSTDGARTGGPAPRAMDSLESAVQGDRLVVRYRYFRQLVPDKQVIG